jgi:hypothetical protein
VRARASEEGGREEALLLVDHLVELGFLSLLTDSLSWMSPAPLREYALRVLQQLFRFGKSHTSFKETPMMSFLSPLFAENERGDGRSESRVRSLQRWSHRARQVVNSKKRKREKEGEDESLSS